MATVAIDAMGGDNAPVETVHGGIDAAANGHKIVLVGDEAQLGPILHSAGIDLPIVHASEAIEMSDDPAIAIREKRDASISVAARLVKNGDADAVVSAGSTGAALTAAVFTLGRLKGVSRPAIASYFPSGSVVLDMGANRTCRAQDLARFAVMGAALARTHYGLDRATVGLLNIGSEPGKGRVLEREAHELIASVPGIDFVGNVEGTDLSTATESIGRSRPEHNLPNLSGEGPPTALRLRTGTVRRSETLPPGHPDPGAPHRPCTAPLALESPTSFGCKFDGGGLGVGCASGDWWTIEFLDHASTPS